METKKNETKNKIENKKGVPTLHTGAILAQGVAQVGCLTLAIVLGGLGLGLLLDSKLETSPWFTLGLILASVPISLVAVARVALSTARQATSSQPEEPNEGDEE
ncbi:MAG: hypothetical protein B5M51_08830 [Anaerolinea sp. 4484_236]|nr:MAG: hypothetical protein B5M51_08830 [Anaerolinea sp. 4484_236]RLD09400.1 MAG: hypothetical protein DRI56_04350 [Chloroflexota bacterium]